MGRTGASLPRPVVERGKQVLLFARLGAVAYARMPMQKPSKTVLIVGGVAVAVVLLVGAGAIGWAIGDSGSGSSSASMTMAPTGHTGGPNLSVSDIGDPMEGRALFVSKSCANCHTYLGKGGKDAPTLDFMRGHLSAEEIANMSGRIWDHLPVMISAFKEEGIKLPTFTGNEMANLIAYLHSGEGGAPEIKEGEGMDMGGGG
jgi:mono/diheme cytochrome c family protein